MESFSLACVVLMALFHSANALQCYQCVNLESDSNLFSGKSNPSCTRGDFDRNSVGQISCRDGYSCAFVTGKLTVSEPLIGDTSVKMDVRDCMRSTGTGDSCSKDDKSAKNMLKTLNVFASIFNSKLDVDVCTCQEDLCDAACPGASLLILGKCFSPAVVGGVGAAVLIIMIGLCCCCCCCCCRRKKTPQPVIIVANAPQPLNPIQGASDPRYGYNQCPQNIVPMTQVQGASDPRYGYNQCPQNIA